MSGSTDETAIVWFRRDLRVHDNPTLTATATADEVIHQGY
ncbi:MAG: deoxyribodipyrimidine photo-lyase [Halobacteriales archaeon]